MANFPLFAAPNQISTASGNPSVSPGHQDLVLKVCLLARSATTDSGASIMPCVVAAERLAPGV
jgi:hypothetical protein